MKCTTVENATLKHAIKPILCLFCVTEKVNILSLLCVCWVVTSENRRDTELYSRYAHKYIIVRTVTTAGTIHVQLNKQKYKNMQLYTVLKHITSELTTTLLRTLLDCHIRFSSSPFCSQNGQPLGRKEHDSANCCKYNHDEQLPVQQ